MGKPRLAAGGGMQAMLYVFRKGHEAGGVLRLYRRMRSKNTCKTCALGMGGQKGGMTNERGHFPEVCKKSVQAQAGDMAGAITEEFIRRTPIAFFERMTSAELEKLGRIAFPMISEVGDSHFRRISWEEALKRTASAFRAAPPEESFFYSSGRASNEAAFLLQLVARAYGTANVHNCSYYCHAASGVALGKIYGSGTSSLVLDDLEKADLAVISGANPASNHPRLITMLMRLRRRGGKVIVINPLKELGLVRFRVPSDWRSMLFGSSIASIYLQPHIGGDIALSKALLKGVIEKNGIDRQFIASYTSGWEALEADVIGASWDELVRTSGVSRAQIDEAVDALLQAKRGVFLWAMGLTHHLHGVDNIVALSNLAISRGWLGKEGAGLLPIRGHSNVQGVGSMGVSPEMKQGFAAKLESLYGIKVSASGQDTYASMVAAHEGRIQAAFLLGGNLFGSNPDRDWSRVAMQRIGLTAYVSTKMNEGHVHGRGRTSVILPCLARDEESQATTQESMFNYVRLSEGGEPAIEGELRSEVEILASLAERVLPPERFDWKRLRSHAALREEIAKTVAGFEPLAEIDKTKREFQIGGRTFHEPKFKTPDGKAHFYVTPLPPSQTREGEFRLMTIRSEGQFNTVVYDEEDLYRGNTRRDVVMMAEEDAKRLGLQEGTRVLVENEVGQMDAIVSITDIRAGNLAMYCPEANALVPRKLDPASKTPAFKCALVSIRRSP